MKTLTILSFVFFALTLKAQKNDYISFECVGAYAHSTMVIYISKRTLPTPELVGSFDYSPARLDYIVSSKNFFFFEHLINSAPKQKFEEGNENGVIIKTRKRGVADFLFINKANFEVISKQITSYLKRYKEDKTLLMALESIYWIKPKQETKNDYIAFDTDGWSSLSTCAIYLSKTPVPKSQLFDRYDETSHSLNYVIPKPAFALIRKLIDSTPKMKFDTTPVLQAYNDEELLARDTAKGKITDTILLATKWTKDTSHVIIKVRKNKTVTKYLIPKPDAELIASKISLLLTGYSRKEDLMMDFNNLTWSDMQADSLKKDYIEIEERASSSDKPPQVIWISKNPLAESEMHDYTKFDDQGYNYIVYEDEYSFICKNILSTMHKNFEEKDIDGFKIHLRKNGNYEYYFIKYRSSNLFFTRIATYLKHHKRNKELILQLEGYKTNTLFRIN